MHNDQTFVLLRFDMLVNVNLVLLYSFLGFLVGFEILRRKSLDIASARHFKTVSWYEFRC